MAEKGLSSARDAIAGPGQNPTMPHPMPKSEAPKVVLQEDDEKAEVNPQKEVDIRLTYIKTIKDRMRTIIKDNELKLGNIENKDQ